MDQFVMDEGFHHELGEVHPASEVGLQDRVANMSAPHRQALAVALLQVAAAYDGPSGVAGEDPPARVHLVVEVRVAGEFRQWTGDLHDRPEPPRVPVLTVTGDVPPA